VWNKVLGQRALWLSDHKKLAEVVVSAIQVNEGADVGAVSDSWSGDTSVVVRSAVGGLAKPGDVAPASGVTRF
jgi:hypothetical protein